MNSTLKVALGRAMTPILVCVLAVFCLRFSWLVGFLIHNCYMHDTFIGRVYGFLEAIFPVVIFALALSPALFFRRYFRSVDFLRFLLCSLAVAVAVLGVLGSFVYYYMFLLYARSAPYIHDP